MLRTHFLAYTGKSICSFSVSNVLKHFYFLYNLKLQVISVSSCTKCKRRCLSRERCIIRSVECFPRVQDLLVSNLAPHDKKSKRYRQSHRLQTILCIPPLCSEDTKVFLCSSQRSGRSLGHPYLFWASCTPCVARGSHWPSTQVRV